MQTIKNSSKDTKISLILCKRGELLHETKSGQIMRAKKKKGLPDLSRKRTGSEDEGNPRHKKEPPGLIN